jgi:sugar phosphate isomerase/epimerase
MELILAATTLWQVPIEVRARAARAAGFAAIGVHHSDPGRWRAGGRTDSEVAKMLDEIGMPVAEVGFLHRWADSGAAAATESDELLALANVLGAARVNVGLFEAPAAGRATPGFKALCRAAAAHGLEVALEFFSFGGLPTLAAACDLIQAAAEPNAGLLLDTWQLHRCGASSAFRAGLAAHPEIRLSVVQIADAASWVPTDVGHESRHSRLLPGEGVIDLVAMLGELAHSEPRPPVAVEVISDALEAQDPFAVARLAAATTRSVLEAAGWPA